VALKRGWALNFDLLVSIQDAKSGGFSGFGVNYDEFKTVGLHESKLIPLSDLGGGGGGFLGGLIANKRYSLHC